MNRAEVLQILHDQQQELVESYHITYLSIFGSVARDEARRESKVGILVKFARPTAFFQFLNLKKYLETLLGCQVELGKPCFLRSDLKLRVLREAIRVF